MARTRPQPRTALSRISLREDYVRSAKPHAVDRDLGVIKHVKIIGQESENGRRYLPEALSGAKALYEGRVVNIDHPPRPDRSRDSADRFGRLVNVTVESDGLYGDLEFLKSHPMAERICEAAERMPEIFGLSHNAQGEGETTRDGLFIVHHIVEVRSVDVVADPATTNGLFESVNPPMKIKIKKFLLETVLPKFPADRQPRLKAVLEADGGMDPEMEMDMPDEGLSHEDHMKAGMKAACEAILEDDEMSADEKCKKLKEYLKAHEKLAGADNEEESEDESEREMGESEDGELKKEFGEAKRTIAALQRKDKARDLCEAAKIVPDKVLLEALLSAKDEAAMKRLIDRESKLAPKPKAKSSAGVNLTESIAGIPDTAEGRINLLRQRV